MDKLYILDNFILFIIRKISLSADATKNIIANKDIKLFYDKLLENLIIALTIGINTTIVSRFLIDV